jgi:dihydroneopterin aldolase/2-amino-4-hydroxy-6-hydroxymethyldihydropteridine diphosphokinase
MDKIYIKDLQVYGYHGVNQQEKEMGQRFLITLELYLDLKIAGQTDDLNNTVNYGQLCVEVEEEFKKEIYCLIEKSAEKLAEFILQNYSLVSRVKVLVKKPWAPIGKPLEYAAVEIDRKWSTAYIALGSNLGNKEKNLKDAVKLIDSTLNTNLIKTSNIYETKPVGYLDQDNFLNCAVKVKTLLTPKALIHVLLGIEKQLKRERLIKWGPRTIDLDILLYDDIITCDEEVIIPHPRMHERMFVLKPLCDIAPYYMHPILHKRIIELMENIEEK